LIHALAKLPQLKKLVLDKNIFGRNSSEYSCVLFRQASLLETCPSVLALAAMIENSSKLEEVSLCQCALGIADIKMLIGALWGNTTLKHLALFGKDGGSGKINTIGERGWIALADQLCNTESVNSIYHSNHTLQCIYDKAQPPNRGFNPPDKIQHLLLLNAQEDKRSVALKKRLLFNNDEIAVAPPPEWGIKLLPFVVGWFTNAKDRINTKEVTLCVENDLLHMPRQGEPP
jgi:hypothetical protein